MSAAADAAAPFDATKNVRAAQNDAGRHLLRRFNGILRCAQDERAAAHAAAPFDATQ